MNISSGLTPTETPSRRNLTWEVSLNLFVVGRQEKMEEVRPLIPLPSTDHRQHCPLKILTFFQSRVVTPVPRVSFFKEPSIRSTLSSPADLVNKWTLVLLTSH